MRRDISIRTAFTLVLLSGATVASALVADFDTLTEGQSFDMFSDGGIRFHDVITHEGGTTNFAIEDASGGFLGEGLSPPNVLGFGGWVPGPNVQFGAIGAFWFTSDSLATTAGLDIWTFPGDPGMNTVTLRGRLAGQLRNSVSFTFQFDPTPTHHRLDLPTDTYDSFEVFSSGSIYMGDSPMTVDNVTVAAVPEPTGLVALGLGTALVSRRRRMGR